jgi:hypothetical protein
LWSVDYSLRNAGLNHLAFAAGQREEAISTSGRTLIFISYMLSVLLVASFSAFLVSSLAVQPRHLPFSDLQGLVNDGSYSLGVVQNSSVLNIFDVCLRRMYVRMYACMCICMYVCIFYFFYLYIVYCLFHLQQ